MVAALALQLHQSETSWILAPPRCLQELHLDPRLLPRTSLVCGRPSGEALRCCRGGELKLRT